MKPSGLFSCESTHHVVERGGERQRRRGEVAHATIIVRYRGAAPDVADPSPHPAPVRQATHAGSLSAWLPLLSAPLIPLRRAIAFTSTATQIVSTQVRRPAGATAVLCACAAALALTLLPARWLRSVPPRRAPAATPAATPAAPLVLATPAPRDSRLADLLSGVEVRIEGEGVWPLRAGAVRLRLDVVPLGSLPPAPTATSAPNATPIPGQSARRIAQSAQRLTRSEIGDLAAPRSGAEASSLAQRLLQLEYGALDVVATQSVYLVFLGPEEPGASAAAGVTAPSEPVLERRGAWAVIMRVQDRQLAAVPIAGAAGLLAATGATGSAAPLRAAVEMLVLDAQTGGVLTRPPKMSLADLDSVLRRRGRSPSLDPTRPLGFFGDAAP